MPQTIFFAVIDWTIEYSKKEIDFPVIYVTLVGSIEVSNSNKNESIYHFDRQNSQSYRAMSMLLPHLMNENSRTKLSPREEI